VREPPTPLGKTNATASNPYSDQERYAVLMLPFVSRMTGRRCTAWRWTRNEGLESPYPLRSTGVVARTKLLERRQQLQRMLHDPALSPGDRRIARDLLIDIQDALSGR
jgi:hypothetical protein